MSALPWLQPLERGDRSVERLHLRLPAGESQSRVSFVLEEALRLTVLPGEEQGRTYYFRRVAFQNLPLAAPRSLWMDTCQKSLGTLAERAIHGRDARAAEADSVFFLTQQEALEWFLGCLLGVARSMAVSSPVELPWFAPMISDVPLDESVTSQFIAVIERLRRLPSGWFAAAIAIFSTSPASAAEVASILVSLPVPRVRTWLQEFSWSDAATTSHALSPSLSSGKREILRRIIAMGGFDWSPARLLTAGSHEGIAFQPEPRLVWLAALAIAAEQPSELSRGTLVKYAETLMESLAAAAIPPSARPDRANDIDPIPAETPETPPAQQDGQPTEAAGLYFLLNALRHLGIESALRADPALERYGFLPRLLVVLARSAGVSVEDPVLDWAHSALQHVRLHIEPVIAASSWPRNLPVPPAGLCVQDSTLVRIWKLAVRRWCWRLAGLTVREIINRPGRILLNRADLDVTLSLELVDVRIRRVGLDLDPGWLPWFGRVVRFHYVRAPRPLMHHAKDGGKP
jgi:hypothetical protein